MLSQRLKQNPIRIYKVKHFKKNKISSKEKLVLKDQIILIFHNFTILCKRDRMKGR